MYLLKYLVAFAVIITASTNFSFSENDKFISPLKRFKLDGWKLQIPGSKDITSLENYASKLFFSQ